MGLAACETATEVVWPRLPLRVLVDPQLSRETVDMAMWYWSYWLGQEVFVRSSYGFDVIIHFGGEGEMIRGYASLYREQGVMTGEVYVFALAIVDSPIETVTHELGHILGLKHDPDDERSIMHPYGPREIIELQPQDKEALLGRYPLPMAATR